MTPNDIVAKANALHDVSIDTAADATFITKTANDFQDDIAEHITPVGTTTNIVVADTVTWYALPTDLIELYQDEGGDYIITKDGTETTDLKLNNDFYVRDIYPTRQVKFAEAGTYTFKYYKRPAALTDNATDNFDMHVYLQDIGDLYFAGKYLLKDGDDNGYRLMAEYEEKRDNRISKIVNPDGSLPEIRIVP